VNGGEGNPQRVWDGGWGEPRTEERTGARAGGPLQSSPTSKLRVPLLHIAQPLHEHLDRDVIVISEEVSLCAVPRKVDERVGIGRDSCEASEDVAGRVSAG
jgi:hypothetical protein